MIRTRLAVLMLALLAACGGGTSTPNPEDLPGLVAQKRAPVEGPGRCGIDDAWVVNEVAGVRLSTPSLMNMRTARALDNYVRNGAVPVIGSKGGGLVELKVVAHYSCRTRNNRKGAKLSEHATGNAIDIAEYVLADGTRLSVLDDWRGANGGTVRALHKAACGPFGTVLGPNADRHHQDHFHFDTASYRSGPYCR